jgi:hypothetical protein
MIFSTLLSYHVDSDEPKTKNYLISQLSLISLLSWYLKAFGEIRRGRLIAQNTSRKTEKILLVVLTSPRQLNALQ